MPKWHQWISDDNEEIVDDYQTFKKIPRKNKSMEEKLTPKKRESLRVPREDKE